MLPKSTSGDIQMPKPNFDDPDPLNIETIQTPDLKLPHFIKDHVPRITCDQLSTLLSKQYLFSDEGILLLDARYPYEYKGGHINGAQNVISRSQLRHIFKQVSNCKYLVICYCEFSKKRGPLLYQIIRSYDRQINHYPILSIPELYVLDGGYKQFYNKYNSLCLGGYTEMLDEHFVHNGELRRCFSYYKKQMERPRSNCCFISYFSGKAQSQKRKLNEKAAKFFTTSSSQPDPFI